MEACAGGLFAAVGALAMIACPARASAQDNYEIQIYGSDLVAPGRTMLELHSNYTATGRAAIADSVSATEHALHETLELTHGFTPWFEVGFYLFTTFQADGDWNWVGDHVRPRFAAPKQWHWPVGASLSFEAGYQRRAFATDTWTLEVRPFIDDQWGKWYWSVNPVLDLALGGQDVSRGLAFSPNVGVSYWVTRTVDLALEYYGSVGPLSRFDPVNQQQHQMFSAFDLHLSPEVEFNAGVGLGLTGATDRLILKMITGYRF
jgi:hypothetical protein